MSKTDVLIVGAGPVGLTLAAECHRQGVAFRIVDQNAEHSTHSKALAIWSNTTEHLAALGLADRFIAAGRPVHRGIFEDNGKKIAEMHIGVGLDSLYPQPFILPQSETEALLLEHLGAAGVTVERRVTAVDVRAGAEQVEVDLQKTDGSTETVTAGWVAGCDGARSLVRHKLPVEFPGVTEKMGFILADAKATGDLPNDAMVASSGPGGNVIIFPVKEGIWRFFALRDENDDRSEPTLEEIQQHLDGAGLSRVRISEPQWLSHFVVNERVASRNRVGRVFLLGDASHIHSPAGGQGMNTGMQDAFNLAWKLKLLAAGRGDTEAIAESYFEERHRVAEQVIRETSNLLHFGVQNHRLIRAAKRVVLPLLSHSEKVNETASFKFSELGIAYAQSSLVEPDAEEFRHFRDLAPGTLARDAEVFAGGEKVSLWRELLHPGHTLLIFSGPRPDRDEIATMLSFDKSEEVRPVLIWHGTETLDFAGVEEFLDPEGKAHERYGLTAMAGWYVVRPDNYIAARGTLSDTTALTRYMRKIGP